MRRIGRVLAGTMAAGTLMLPTTPAAAAAPESPGLAAPAVGSSGMDYPELPRMIFNAAPEPVRRGGTVTLRAMATDGWEGTARVRMRFYFRPVGASHFAFRGSAMARCIAYCDSGDIAQHRATKRFVQRTGGTWESLTSVRYWREDGFHTRVLRAYDTVLVRR